MTTINVELTCENVAQAGEAPDFIHDCMVELNDPPLVGVGFSTEHRLLALAHALRNLANYLEVVVADERARE